MNENTQELRQIPITRAELIERLMDDAKGGFDFSDYASVLRYGMNGFENYTNEELENQALEWCLLDEDGNEIRYTITDADTSKPSPEAINAELLQALKGLAGCVDLSKLNVRKDFSLLNAHACAMKAIAKAEGRAS